ncbi:hypothetical protein V5799_002920 [Amblyomma americanum]|uniref:Single domain-containing protein n=1 Tax=Amblyomma americanum TaxID=6943 RepID=A0AAQ4DAF8_AMBAM
MLVEAQTLRDNLKRIQAKMAKIFLVMLGVFLCDGVGHFQRNETYCYYNGTNTNVSYGELVYKEKPCEAWYCKNGTLRVTTCIGGKPERGSCWNRYTGKFPRCCHWFRLC